MQCSDTLAPIPYGNGTAVALGYFDGVHLGHQNVLNAAQRAAARQQLSDAVFTFRLPPNSAAKGRAILTQTEKQRRMAARGVQHYFCPPFESFCAFTPQAFVEEVLLRCLGAKHVFCGDNFTFGAHKSGNVDTLKTLCAAHGIGVHIVPMAEYDGALVSSSRIRACLEQGDLHAANAMLSDPYCLDMPVQHGKSFGRTLGFPTINQSYPPQMLVPKSGVYITETCVDGTWLPSATGLGTRPTVSGEGVTCETFIVDYTGNLYGDTVRVRFHSYLKPTVKFDTVDALKAYIDSAADAARTYFAQKP